MDIKNSKESVVRDIAQQLYTNRIAAGDESKSAEDDWADAETLYDEAFACGGEAVELPSGDGKVKFEL